MEIQLTDELYETMIRRDTKFDGKLFVAIKSTKIVCFPSCRSRLPKRENVVVYETVEQAVQAGFRLCKRCKPHPGILRAPDTELVDQVYQLLHDRYDEHITLGLISDHLAVSPYHLQRTFKRITGVSPTKALEVIRVKKAKQLLSMTERSIGEIAALVGFRSAAHFTKIFREETEETPSVYRKNLKR